MESKYTSYLKKKLPLFSSINPTTVEKGFTQQIQMSIVRKYESSSKDLK